MKAAGANGMDEVRPLEADHGIRSGGAGRRPTNDARGSARSIARRETAVVTDARRTRPIGAAHRSLRAGDPLRRTARPPAGATPTTEDHARKKPRNALIRFKTGAKMTRPAQTSETPQTTALPGDGPEPDKSDALPVPQNRKWRRNPLINLETDSEMARRAQARETPQATAFASGVLPRFAIAARGRRRGGAFPPLRVSAGEGKYVLIKPVDREAVVGTVRFRPHDRSIAPNLPIVHDLFSNALRPGRRTAVGVIEGPRLRAPEAGRPPMDPRSPGSQGQTAAAAVARREAR